MIQTDLTGLKPVSNQRLLRFRQPQLPDITYRYFCDGGLARRCRHSACSVIVPCSFLPRSLPLMIISSGLREPAFTEIKCLSVDS